MLTNKVVVSSWLYNVPNKAKHLHTDGRNLYSYSKRIGYTLNNGTKIVENLTTKGGKFISKTTSSHVHLAQDMLEKHLAKKAMGIGLTINQDAKEEQYKLLYFPEAANHVKQWNKIHIEPTYGVASNTISMIYHEIDQSNVELNSVSLLFDKEEPQPRESK